MNSSEDQRLSEITSSIIAMANLDFRSPPPLHGTGPLDAVAAALHALGEELDHSVGGKQEAKAANRARAEFLGDMSHELRTPLTTMMGCAELLQNTTLTAVQQELVWQILRASKRLEHIISDVLEFAQIGAGQVDVQSIPFSPVEMVTQTVSAHTRLAQTKGLWLEVDVQRISDCMYIGDPSRIIQILSNLLSNSIKYTQVGGIWVRGETEARDKDTLLRLEVQDTGIGIPALQHQDVFDRSVRGSNPDTRINGGIGIGLCIVRELVELMDGQARLTSAEGEGTTFCVEIPLQPDPAVSPPTSPNPVHAPLNKRVLIVDDNADILRIAKEMLQLCDCTVETVSSGASAVEFVLASHFDMVLMDCQMPGMSGYEATRQIHSLLNEQAPPIVGFTAHLLRSDKDRTREAGMVDHVPKPFTLKELRAVVQRWTSNDE
jgi:signal transduction histidine kinase/CheY-like chemotaxis protein